MIRVLFYTLPFWIFGSIHNSLAKQLYQHGIFCELLDWTKPYTKEEFKLINETYDIFVTTPESIDILHKDFDIPYSKIYSIAHGQHDILLTKKKSGLEVFDKIGKYGVVSEILKTKSKEFGLARVPEVLTVGTHFDLFYQKPARRLDKIGYAGAREVINHNGVEIKRGNIVKEVAADMPYIKFIEHKFYHYTAMPSYYKNIDALVVSSIEESVGYPFMESSCGGRLPFTTSVGYANEHGKDSGHITLPISNKDYPRELKKQLTYFHINNEEYAKKCKDVQEFARENYDWSKHIEKWIKFFLEV